jgi:hypothetical protein
MIMIIRSLAKISRRLEFRRTTDAPRTAQIHIAGLEYEVEVQMGDGDDGVVKRIIDMPLVAVAMQEDGDVGQGPVPVNDVSIRRLIRLRSNPGLQGVI